MERASVGVSELDQVMLGGIPRGSLVLVLGPPGAGKSIFGKLFLYNGISNDEEAVLLTTSENKQTIEETMKQFNWLRESEGKISLIDCYSWKLGQTGEFSPPLTSLTDVALSITRMLDKINKQKKARFVLDSFSDFIKYSGVDRSIRFLDSVHTKLRERNVTGLLLLEEGMHAQRTVAAVEYSTDGTIRMRFQENGRFMMVSRMSATPVIPRWIPFTIGK